jgi:hypothetical protein
VKPSIVAVTDDAVIFGPDAATLTAWALNAHLETCRACRHEYCPTGAHLDAASRPDRSWIPDPRTGA